MSRLIRKLPEDIRVLAEKRAKEYQKKGYRNDPTTLGSAFSWSETPEGWDYWANVNRTGTTIEGQQEKDGIFK